ncbi:hypothetical protein [Microbacterium maritypicum]
MSSNTNSPARPGAGLLRVLADDDLRPPASRIADRELRPVPFTPESGREDEADGAPLTKFGGRFREVFAEAQGIAQEEVDLGIVRLLEALNADTERNLAGLAAPLTKRTEHGIIRQVRLVVNTPMLLPWLSNGRALRKMGRELDGSAKVITRAVDHPGGLKLPAMHTEGPDSVLALVAAQRSILKLDSMASAEKSPVKRGRIDSIAQFGVLSPPDVVATQLISADGSAWVAEVAEGAQRLFSSLLGLDTIAARSVSRVATEAWFTEGARRIRDLGPADLVRLETSLRFPGSAAAGFIPGPNIGRWVEQVAESDPAAVAFQLMRTMEVNFVIGIEPDQAVMRGETQPVSATLQELVRSYHVFGKSKDPWEKEEVDGLVAIGAIDDLREADLITEGERSHWLGETSLPWNGEYEIEDGAPGNRLLSVTRLMAALTVDGDFLSAGATSGTVIKDIVNRHLAENAVWVHPDQRARVASAQAISPLELAASGAETTVQSALHATFRSAWFWNQRHTAVGECWPTLLSLPLNELEARAQAEREARASAPDDNGPAQLALAALGGVALMVNPGLLATDDSLSRTGRGAGGRRSSVKASDPNVILSRMVQSERGIRQLHDAVAALTAGSEPTLPLDRETREPLTDLWLRGLWLEPGAPEAPSSPKDVFLSRIAKLVFDLKLSYAESETLKEVTMGDLLGLERDDDGDPALWSDFEYEVMGIPEDYADQALPLLQQLSEFFTTGKAFSRAASRAQR